MKTTKSKRLQLVECYADCMKLSNKLEIKLQKLGNLATSVYGKNLQADMCAGEEIEFRVVGEDGYGDADSCILIEDIINS